MKSFTKTIFATVLTAVIIASSAFTGKASGPVEVRSFLATPIQGINKIWVSGNVKLVLTQGNVESINGTESYDESKTSVQIKGQTLYVNSISSSQVTLNINLKDLQRIEAYGQSVILTSNSFDVKYLQVFLNQSAKARVNTLTGSLYTVIKDDATLKMSGVANEHTMLAGNMKNVRLVDFVCLKNNKAQLTDSIKLVGLTR